MVIRVRGIEIDPPTRTIRHGEREWRGVSPVRWRLTVSLILGGGLLAEELLELCYGHDPNGGPNGGRDAVRIMTWHAILKKQYAHLGLKIHTTRVGEPRKRYELIPAHMERGSR